jgi:hypothetical protein
VLRCTSPAEPGVTTLERDLAGSPVGLHAARIGDSADPRVAEFIVRSGDRPGLVSAPAGVVAASDRVSRSRPGPVRPVTIEQDEIVAAAAHNLDAPLEASTCQRRPNLDPLATVEN